MSETPINNVIILFDEQGTPTFGEDRETDYFLGVAVTYKIALENELFDNYNDLLGLNRSRPMKNDKISFSRVNDIAEILAKSELQINVYYIDLSNSVLQSIVKLYEDFSNLFRTKYRNVRERPIAQILYNQLLDHTLFMSISDYMKYHQITTKFSINADNWCFPKCDVNIALNLTSSSLEKKNNDINQRFFPGVFTICDKIKLLEEDSKRKRFIDVVASVISRGYLSKSDSRFNDKVLKTIFRNDNYVLSETDITNKTVETLNLIMDNISRNGYLSNIV